MCKYLVACQDLIAAGVPVDFAEDIVLLINSNVLCLYAVFSVEHYVVFSVEHFQRLWMWFYWRPQHDRGVCKKISKKIVSNPEEPHLKSKKMQKKIMKANNHKKNLITVKCKNKCIPKIKNQ